jgi:selenocysteine-specific elongation factor
VYVVATAGHVDHGKSMLVRALTGMEPDRWEAERSRGMTIDLGYAWTTLPSGDELAFVDVPGHERFITNMLAGLGPVAAVMFVVAADEGWMPQSAEHLAAIDALGVRHGLLVVTRSDLADPGPVLRRAAHQIAGTSLGEVEAVAVSALTGQGLPELTAALGRLTARLPRPDPRGAIRLWLDRVFAIKGSGTVVTGTLQAGTVRPGDELTVAPAMRTVRIRGVQSLGAPAAHVGGVARVALNLRGTSTRELGRGMALIQPGRWTVTKVIDVRLAPASGERGQPPAPAPLPSRPTLHIGAARAVAQARMLGSRFARLTLDRPLPLHVGDRVLLRDPGAAPDRAGGRPVFGATVLDVSPPRLRGNGAAAAAAHELASWPELPVVQDLLRRHRLLRAGQASAMGLNDLPPPVAGDWLADPGHWARLRQSLAAAVAAHAARDPLAPGLAIGAARAELGLPGRDLVEALAAWPVGSGSGGRIEAVGGYLRGVERDEPDQPEDADGAAGPGQRAERTASGAAPEHRPAAAGDAPVPGQRPGIGGSAQAPGPRLPAPVASAVQAVLADLADAPFHAPEAERLRELGIDARAAAAAERAGLLCRLPGNILLAPGAPDRAARILAGLPQPFSTSDARQALGTSRRVAIPLLEWLDRAGVTRRLPDDRRLMREPPGSPRQNGEQ